MELVSIQNIGLEKNIEDNYDFPTFYFSFSNKKFYFKPISLEVGSLNFISGENNCGKSLFLKTLTGQIKPNEIPNNKNFLNYNIIYKPENISPKYSNTLNNFILDYSLKNNKYFPIFKNILSPYLNEPIKTLPEEIKQIISFLLFIDSEGIIYIFDCPSTISTQTKIIFWNILKEISYQQDKIALVVDNDTEIIKNIIDKENGKIYHIKKFSDNEFYGEMI